MYFDVTKIYTNSYYNHNKRNPSFIWIWEKVSRVKHAKKITFSSVFQKDFKLEGEDFMELVYDDFKDLI